MGPEESADAGIAVRIEGDAEARIVVAGCGGAGCNVVSRVYEKAFPGVETLAVNTDAGSLDRTSADVRILLAQGVSIDGDPVLASYAAEACRDLLQSATTADIVFLVAGLGGATGTGAAPVMAQAARDAGAHTIGVAILPFREESRRGPADESLARLKACCDSLVVLDNDNLLRLASDLTLREGFHVMNQVVLTLIEGVLEHLSTAVLTSVAEELESVARDMREEPSTPMIEVATPVVEAASAFVPVAFDASGFIGLR
jgi:cell division protein FtsZ